MEYADWINEVKQSREDNEESLREITADWNLGTTTGRMANTNPDLQTIPGTEYKKKRFIGISEALTESTIDNESLMRLTGDA